jgi:stage II sporulation protein E
MYSEGFRTFGLITADFLCGVLLFLPLCRLLPQKTSSVSAFAGKDMMHKETMRSAKQKLKRMSEAFSSLSEVFYTVSDSMKKPQLTEASRLVSDCCSEVCSRCSLSGICWGREHSLHVEASSRVASRLLVSGQVEKKDFGEPFATGCKNLEELCALVNRRFEELSGNFIKNNKTRLLAGEYSSVSRLLKNTAGELDLELEYNPGLEQRAKKVLKELGISYRRVAVFGTREIKIDVYGILLERVSLATDQVLLAFEREFHCVFDSPGFLMFEESVVMRLRRRRALSLECAKSGCTKKGESINGDSVSFFETDRDYFYTLICDGMGSGREAAFTSRLASIFIEKLMHCATPKNVSLEMLNAFLMSKTDETFTTVDLLEVDLLSGEANFMKAGAAPSFVLRGDRLHRIESRTPPAGVLYRMCAEQTAFSLRDGDFIIQLSDGAEESDGSSDWLAALVGGNSYENAAALCEQIFSKAKEQAAFRDDLSICVLRVVNSK